MRLGCAGLLLLQPQKDAIASDLARLSHLGSSEFCSAELCGPVFGPANNAGPPVGTSTWLQLGFKHAFPQSLDFMVVAEIILVSNEQIVSFSGQPAVEWK